MLQRIDVFLNLCAIELIERVFLASYDFLRCYFVMFPVCPDLIVLPCMTLVVINCEKFNIC